MLKKIMFTIISFFFVLIMVKTTYSSEIFGKVSSGRIASGSSFTLFSPIISFPEVYDGRHRHRGPLYYYYTEPLNFRHPGHRHKDYERHERHEHHEKHKHHEKHHH